MWRRIGILSVLAGVLCLGSAALAGPQVLEVSPRYLEFTGYEGGADPAAQVVSIWNSGNGPMDWTVTPDCNWVTVEPNSGASLGEVDDANIIVDINGLAEGTYNCQLTVTGSGAPNSPQVVDVNLFVYQPVIELSSMQLEFIAFEGEANPDDQIISISNSGTGELNWQITEGCGWLTVEPNSGSSTGEADDVNVSVDITGLTVGTYDCNLMVSGTFVVNSPQIVDVDLVIYGELQVPSKQYNSIQSAINAAVPGQTVVVKVGTHYGDGNRDIDFLGKAITIRSTDPNDPNIVAATIIDCEGSEAEPHRAFYFHSGEDRNSVINGLTITNGFGHYEIISGYEIPTGGGIYCYESSPTIRNCIITQNTAYNIIDLSGGVDFHIGGRGAGIYCYQSDAKIDKCTISNNRVCGGTGWAFGTGGLGAGIYCEDSNVVISKCTFSENETEWLEYSEDWYPKGGGIYVAGGTATISGCTISDNYGQTGGGIYCFYCSPIATIEDCSISSNNAWSRGGGLSIGSNTNVWNCRIAENWVLWAGGGIHGGGRIENCVIYQNTAWGDPDLWGGIEAMGAGIYCYSSSTIINCTIYNNDIGFWGEAGGIYCDGSPTINNCIIWDNDWIEVSGGSPAIMYSDVQGGYTGIGNIDANPCFVDAANGDYHLQSAAGRWDANSESWVADGNTSPCIDAGNPGCPLGDEPKDVNNVRINMGAYGGTAEASKSPANWRNIADMTNDGAVDESDLSVFVDWWVQSGECIPSDLDRNQSADFVDFDILGENWLAGL